MNSTTTLPIALALTLLAPGNAGALSAGATPNTLQETAASGQPPATIDAVAWIAGSWEGEALGGWAEEVWTPPRTGHMLGMFRLLDDRGAKFSELLSISEEGSSLLLRLKHFHPDLRGWEERDEVARFPLVKLDEHAVYFAGLTFRRRGPDGLDVYVASRDAQGETRELHFAYTRRADAVGSADPDRPGTTDPPSGTARPRSSWSWRHSVRRPAWW